MINPLALMKKAKNGTLTQDEIEEALSMIGIEAEFATVPAAETLPAFQHLAGCASLPSASLLRIKVSMKDGQQFTGLLVCGHITSGSDSGHIPA
jgi:hypothetical protein